MVDPLLGFNQLLVQDIAEVIGLAASGIGRDHDRTLSGAVSR